MTLSISNLKASIPGREILRGVDLVVPDGEVHAVMGPNGSGKSTLGHVLLGRPGYQDISGSAILNGRELLGLPTWERVQAGIFLGMQYPTEVPGVQPSDMLAAALRAAGRNDDADNVTALMEEEAGRIGFDVAFLRRALNVDFSGGEKKRNETIQLGVLRPALAILDEVDSGLDVDALRAVSRRVKEATTERGMSVIAITHYQRLLTELTPDAVHIFVDGRIVHSGGPELALELETTGYEPYFALAGVTLPDVDLKDPFADL